MAYTYRNLRRFSRLSIAYKVKCKFLSWFSKPSLLYFTLSVESYLPLFPNSLSGGSPHDLADAPLIFVSSYVLACPNSVHPRELSLDATSSGGFSQIVLTSFFSELLGFKHSSFNFKSSVFCSIPVLIIVIWKVDSESLTSSICS